MNNEGNPLDTTRAYDKDGNLVHVGQFIPVDPIDHGVATGEDYEPEMEYREDEANA